MFSKVAARAAWCDAHAVIPAIPSTLTAPGAVLGGKYRVERVIGQGGMGVVIEAHHLALDERVAIKLLLSDLPQHTDASARFLREARAAVKIKSEHVARVSDVGTLESGTPYMVMEYLAGIDLARRLSQEGPLPIEDAVDAVLQACEAIVEAHKLGIVHRDLKPANLFMSQRPNGLPLIKVLDFGISKMSVAGVEDITSTATIIGSAPYMSPEQMQQTKSVDHRTDIYALGITLYELVTKRRPFEAAALPQLCGEILTGVPTAVRLHRPEVPEALAAVLEKAYARDRAHRWQSAADFALALAPFAPQRSQAVLDNIAPLVGRDAPKVGEMPEAATMPIRPEDVQQGLLSAQRPLAPSVHEAVSAPLTGGASGPVTTSAGTELLQTGAPEAPKRKLGWIAAVSALVLVGIVGALVVVIRKGPIDKRTSASDAPIPSAPELTPTPKEPIVEPAATVSATSTASATGAAPQAQPSSTAVKPVAKAPPPVLVTNNPSAPKPVKPDKPAPQPSPPSDDPFARSRR